MRPIALSRLQPRLRTRAILILLLALAALSLSVPMIVAQGDDTSGVIVSMLQVVETIPAVNEELAPDGSITLYFDRPVDCTTADNLRLTSAQGAVSGRVACEGSALVFTPDTALRRDTAYTLTADTSLRAADGTALPAPYTLALQTAGFLRVTATLPTAGEAEVRTDTTLTLIFNRPVVPLGLPSDGPDLPDPVTIEPAVEGTGAWLNTSVYTFTPATAWAGGTDYTVTVADVEAVDGAVLAAPVSFFFTTISPAVVSVTPANATSGVRLQPRIQVTFNQPMDRASTEAAFYLRPEETSAPRPPGQFTWNDDGTGFMFEPADRLALGIAYEFGFAADAAFEIGRRVTLPAYRAAFVTVPPPAVTSSRPSDGAVDVQPYGFDLFFASPMAPETIAERLVIDPPLYDEPQFFYREWSNSYAVSFPFEPSTPYTVTLQPGAEDIYGNTIDSPFTFSFTTGPYAAEFNLQVASGPVGFYDAGRADTTLYVTHRNISALDLSLYNVPLLDFINALGENRYYSLTREYVPRLDSLLKSWRIPSTAPENRLRYELLDLGSPAPSAGVAAPVACPEALPTRAKVGDLASAIAEPNLRARAAPPNGEILELMYPGYAFEITGGPICANDILWWQIRLRDGREAWVAEGLGSEYFFEITLAAQQTAVTLPSVDLTGGPLPPGVYFLTANAPEFTAQGFSAQRHFLVVANLNITLKSSINGALAWVTDVRSGQPAAGVTVTLYTDNGSPVIMQTDADGLARFSIPRQSDLYVPLIALVNEGGRFGLGFSEWTDGIAPWSFNIPYSYYPTRYALYLYTERPVYRPGQPVFFRGIVRQRDDIAYTVAPNITSVPVTIFDSSGTQVYSDSVPVTAYGSFNGSFTLADDAPLGYYSLNVDLPSDERNYREGGSVGFDVAQYRLPEFQVTLRPVADEVIQGGMIEVEVDTTFFFGGPVADASIEYFVTANDYYFDRYTGPGRFDFTDINYDEGSDATFFGRYGGQVATGTGVSDAGGKFVIEVPAALTRANQSQTFTVEVVARDTTGQTVAGRRDVIVHQGAFYLGVGAASYVGTAGQPLTINTLSLNWDGSPLPAQTAAYEVVERRWSSVQELDRATGRITYSYDVEEIPVAEGTVTTGSDGRVSFDFTPPNGGVYKAKLNAQDAQGNTITASTTVWVSSQDYVAWRISNDRRIELIADRPQYRVGDSAELLITSPFDGPVEVLLTVERAGVLQTDQFTMTENSLVYTLDIAENFAPNVFVGVVLVKGVDADNPVADFRAGLIQLNVNNERLVMDISVQPDREFAGPRETVTYTLTTTDWQGQPVQAELGLALTDLASLSLAPPRTGPILDFFYGLQFLSVSTSTPLTINTDILTQFTLDVIKGGGGGGGDFGIFEVREEFLDTPFWEGALVTDASGQAQVEITLPDNLTTWRLDVRGVTSGAGSPMLVGQTTYDIISTKPVLVRPVTPRFFVVDDAVTLAAVVNNNTDEALPVRVGVQATGLSFDGDIEQTATVPANSSLRFDWPVTVADVENVELIFYADANDGQYTDATRPQIGQGPDRLLPVYKYEAPEVVGTGGVLRSAGGVDEAIALPRRFEVTQGELTVRLESSLAATTLAGLDYFRRCRCENIEATVSRFLPNVVTYRTLTTLNVNLPELRANLEFEVNLALQRLAAQQKVDGGWGWFVAEASDPLVTAYAVVGLVEATNAGFAVDRAMLSRAGRYLLEAYRADDIGLTRATDLNRRAFMLYALGKAGVSEISGLSTLFDRRDNLSLYGKALLALAMHEQSASDSRITTLLDDLFADALLTANGVHWEEAERDFFNWNTDTRTTAMILKTLVAARPDHPLIPGVVRWLMVARNADGWETTQETAWALLALTDWMAVSGELDAEYAYAAALNGEMLAEGAAGRETATDAQVLTVAVAELLRDQANRLRITRTAGAGEPDGALYYTAYLRAFLPVEAIQPLERGLVVQRQYTAFNSRDPITEARVGELVQVRLTIIAPNDLHYVVIEDPLPAGAEAIDPSLATAQQTFTDPYADYGGDEMVEEEDADFSRRWLASWHFNTIQFRDEQVVLNAVYLPAGTYEYTYTIRPSVEGTYNVLPVTGREYYFPEVFGRGAGSIFTVLPPAAAGE